MKRAGNLIEKIADTDNLLLAYYKAQRGKRMKMEVRAFSENLQQNMASLREEILSGKVCVGLYSYFNIHDPKPRLICAASFRERVLHHAIINICHPYFERQLIETTYATRPGKGIYKALDRARSACKKYPYVAKFDFKKYFDSIDHERLKGKLARIFKDRVLLEIFGSIIDSYSRTEGKGLPIGNLTSQYFANYYLSGLDHACKEVLRVPEYIRYMDDFLLFASSWEELERYISFVYDYAERELDLVLKPVVRIYGSGIPFLGYSVHAHKVLLNARSKRRLKHRMILYGKLREKGGWDDNVYLEHITPLLAFARYGYTRGLRQHILRQRTRRLQPREPRGQLEQQCEQLQGVELEQQQPQQQEQQYRFPFGVASIA